MFNTFLIIVYDHFLKNNFYKSFNKMLKFGFEWV
jgi:hypothetical protein